MLNFLKIVTYLLTLYTRRRKQTISLFLINTGTTTLSWRVQDVSTNGLPSEISIEPFSLAPGAFVRVILHTAEPRESQSGCANVIPFKRRSLESSPWSGKNYL